MGVIRCTAPDGKTFGIVICPKSGSTSLRVAFARWRDAGQYNIDESAGADNRIISKCPGWSVSAPYQGDPPLAFAVVRNPYQRLLSKWREKREILGGTRAWPSYVRGMYDTRLGTMSTPQYTIVRHVPRDRRFDLADMKPLYRAVWVATGVHPPVTHKRSHGKYDWRETYREHPDTVALVRTLYAPDWALGFWWESPLD